MLKGSPPNPLSIVLVGAAHIDRIARPADTYRPRVSNPGTMEERTGGACFNASRALRFWNVETHLVGACGGDAAGQSIAAALEAAGIRDGRISWLDRTTPSYTALLDEAGDLVGAVADMALYDLLRPRVLSRTHVRAALSSCHGILVDANLPAETLHSLVRDRHDTPVAAIAVSPAKVVRLRSGLADLSILFGSRCEVVALLELDESTGWGVLADRLMATGLRRAVVTDGANGALVIDGADVWLQAPPRVETVRDVTGAGDTLAAVAFAEWVSGHPLLPSVRIGMAAAGLHISTGLHFDVKAASYAIADRLPAPSTVTA